MTCRFKNDIDLKRNPRFGICESQDGWHRIKNNLRLGGVYEF